MREILEEYGEVLIGVLAAFLIMGVGYALFSDGAPLHDYFSSIANNSI